MPTDFIIAESKDRHQRLYRLCKQPVSGRADKIFFSATCKANYHIKLNKVTMEVSERIDKILHRNRSTLIEIMEKNRTQKKVPGALLDSKNFTSGVSPITISMRKIRWSTMFIFLMDDLQ